MAKAVLERTGPAAVRVGRTLLSATYKPGTPCICPLRLVADVWGLPPILHVHASCISAPGGLSTKVDSSRVTPIAFADCLIPCSTCLAV